MQATSIVAVGNVITADFARARKVRDFEKALAEAKRPRRVSKATKQAQHAQAVRLAAKLAI